MCVIRRALSALLVSLPPRQCIQIPIERNAHAALGGVTYVKGELETSFKKYRRSLFIVKDLPAGHVLTDSDIQAVRPGDGLLPKYKPVLVGRSLRQDVTRGTPVSWDLLA